MACYGDFEVMIHMKTVHESELVQKLKKKTRSYLQMVVYMAMSIAATAVALAMQPVQIPHCNLAGLLILYH